MTITSDGFLHKYFLSNSTKRLHKWVHYFDIYERHFSRFRGKGPVMIEIGVFGGGSLAMWREYFGKDSKIIGIDIDPECKVHESDGVEIFTGSQDDPDLIKEIFKKYPLVDIVLDDGSHMMQHMVSSFELLYERIQPNGIYMVEDMHTCYWAEYGGGLRERGSFMEYAKGKLDELNAFHSRDVLPVSTFTKSTDCIAFYDSVVVFERRPQGMRQALITTAMNGMS
ncbi:MAG: class I SAM-dependent methyltransferase [Chlorobiaceae bacterium]|nr:class I SAM-dependent methyltransferase [Chlorobiaceae bacterium]